MGSSGQWRYAVGTMAWLGGAACAGTPAVEPVEEKEPTAARPVVGAEELCAVHCDRAEVCGVHRNACDQDCPARGRSVNGMRFDFLGHMMLCLDGASCASLVQGVAWRSCHEAVVKMLPVTDGLRRFCFESSRRAARCGRADDADQTACLTEFRYQSDETLDAALSCMKKPCADVPACMAVQLAR